MFLKRVLISLKLIHLTQINISALSLGVFDGALKNLMGYFYVASLFFMMFQ